jgi:hypothetical protein
MFCVQSLPSLQQSFEEQKNGKAHVPSALQMFAVHGSGSTQQPAARLQLKGFEQLPSGLQMSLVQTLPSLQLALTCWQVLPLHSMQPATPPGQFASSSTQTWFSQLWQPGHSSSVQQPSAGMQASPPQHFGVGASQHALEPSAIGQQAVSQQPVEPQHWLSSAKQHWFCASQKTSG